MPWQLWVMIALAVAALVLLAAVRMRHARKVFDDITTLDRPTEPADSAGLVGSGTDELARARARHIHPEPHRKHG